MALPPISKSRYKNLKEISFSLQKKDRLQMLIKKKIVR
jgi:hypothetical protein